MKLLIYSLLCLLLAIAAGVALSRESGLLILVVSDYTIQTSLSFFVLLMVIGFLLLYLAVRFLSGLMHFPVSYRRWKKHRNHRKSEHYLVRGFLALAEGDWRVAEKNLVKGANYSSMPMLNYVGAARAAQQAGAIERRDQFLKLAHLHGAEDGLAVGLTQAQLQLGQNQTEQAYATLRHLDSDNPDKDQVKLLLLDASSSLKDWEQSLQLLQEMEKKGTIPIEKIRARQLQAWSGLLKMTGKTGGPEALQEVWSRIPARLKKELYLVEVYVSQKLGCPDTDDCEKLLRKVLKEKWDPALVRLYGKVEGSHPDRQLAFAEKLLKRHARDRDLLLTLGCLCKRLGLWGKAKSYLEESIEVLPSPDSYYELATLLEEQGNQDAAARYYQQGLALAARFQSADMVLPEDVPEKRLISRPL